MIDKNGNFIPDKLEEKASILWKNKIVIGLCTAIVLLSFQNYKLRDKPPEIKTVQIEKIVEVAKGNVFCVNLDETTMTKKIKMKSRVSGKDIFGVWYSKEETTGDSFYLAKFERVDNLRNNKKAFSSYEEPVLK